MWFSGIKTGRLLVWSVAWSDQRLPPCLALSFLGLYLEGYINKRLWGAGNDGWNAKNKFLTGTLRVPNLMHIIFKACLFFFYRGEIITGQSGLQWPDNWHPNANHETRDHQTSWVQWVKSIKRRFSPKRIQWHSVCSETSLNSKCIHRSVVPDVFASRI